MRVSAFLIASWVGIASAGAHYNNQTTSSSVSSSHSQTSSSLSSSIKSTSSSASATITSSSSLSKSSSLSSSQVLTTYTTVTTCPITYTRRHGSSVELSTSYTTSTITVTSCKEGCNHPHPTGKPTTSTKQPTGPVTVTDYITKFVPCSTPVT